MTAVVLAMLACAAPAFSVEIHDLSRDGDLGKVTKLLRSNRALVDARDNDGNTPLHVAAAYGHKDVAKIVAGQRSGC